MDHSGDLDFVAVLRSLSTAIKDGRRKGVRAALGSRVCKQGALVTEDFPLGVESEEKSLIVKWHTLYSWQEARDVVVLDEAITIPGCGRLTGFKTMALIPCNAQDTTWSTSQRWPCLPILNYFWPVFYCCGDEGCTVMSLSSHLPLTHRGQALPWSLWRGIARVYIGWLVWLLLVLIRVHLDSLKQWLQF